MNRHSPRKVLSCDREKKRGGKGGGMVSEREIRESVEKDTKNILTSCCVVRSCVGLEWLWLLCVVYTVVQTTDDYKSMVQGASDGQEFDFQPGTYST